MATPIKFKLLLVQLIAIIPLLLFIFYIFDLWYDTQRSMIIESNISQAKLIAFSMEDSFNTTLSLITNLAASPLIKAQLTENPTLISNTLKAIGNNANDIGGINISDTSGKIIAHSYELTQTQQMVSLADRDYFQKAVETKQPAISDPLQNRFRNVPSVVIAAPIIVDGKVTAVISAAYDLTVLQKKLETVLPPDRDDTVLIYDKNNRLVMILHKPLPNDKEKALFNNLPFLAKNGKNKVKIIENQKLPNSTTLYLGASVPVNGFDWTVVNLSSMDDTFAPIFKVQKLMFLILLAALLFAISLISYALRKVKIIY